MGDKASNIEIAIAGYEVVSTVFTRDAFPQDWAWTQNNLGIAYLDRIFGEKAENLEQAIASYTAALSVYTRHAFPQQWAASQNSLASAYHGRIRGDKAQNLELAIAADTAALECFSYLIFWLAGLVLDSTKKFIFYPPLTGLAAGS